MMETPYSTREISFDLVYLPTFLYFPIGFWHFSILISGVFQWMDKGLFGVEAAYLKEACMSKR